MADFPTFSVSQPLFLSQSHHSSDHIKERTKSQYQTSFYTLILRLRLTLSMRPEKKLPTEPAAESFGESALIARSATSAIKAAPTPDPSLAIPIRILRSPCGPIPGTSRNASRMYSSKLG